MAYDVALTIGDMLDSPFHKTVHDQIGGLINQIGTDVGDTAKGVHTNVATRLNLEATAHVAVLPTVVGNTNREVFRTSDRTKWRSDGTSWIQTEGPPLFLQTSRVGVNRAPLVPLHVSEDGATGEPVALGSEVGRFSRIGFGRHASASIIGDRLASSSLYLGDQDSVSAGQIKHDHSDNSLRLFSNDLQHISCLADGATIISRDQTSIGPTLDGSVGLRVVRAPEAGSSAVSEIMSGISGRAELRLGDTADPSVGRWSYNNADDTMEGYANASKTLTFTQNMVAVLAKSGSGVGTPAAGVALAVSRNAGGADGCGIQVTSGGVASAWITFGTTPTPDRGKLMFDHNSNEFIMSLLGTPIVRAIQGGLTRVSAHGSPYGLEVLATGDIQMPQAYLNSVAGTANVALEAGGLIRRVTSIRSTKTGIVPLSLDEAVTIVQGVEPVAYSPKSGHGPAGRRYIGVIAEDIIGVDERLGVYTVDPETGEDHWDDPTARTPEYLYYDRLGLIACQVAADHHTKIGDLADLCLIQQVELQELRDRVVALEAV